jgi:N6-adenosine-specific RNA methylase IME4
VSQAGDYAVIYADPPWSYRTWSPAGTQRSAPAHYQCVTFEQLAKLPVPRVTARDAVLLLWAIDPLLPRALDLISAWGFTYKTVGFYWIKKNRVAEGYFSGLGFWTRANPEMCLLATRGRPRRVSKDVRRLVVAPRREHSRKPDEVRTLISRLLNGPYLELFARERAEGWDAWGDQLAMSGQPLGAGTAAT